MVLVWDKGMESKYISNANIIDVQATYMHAVESPTKVGLAYVALCLDTMPKPDTPDANYEFIGTETNKDYQKYLIADVISPFQIFIKLFNLKARATTDNPETIVLG
jgi:hypothetical protein